MIIRVQGVKKATAKGKVYYYHRATGKRLQSEPGTAAFIEEIARLDEVAKSIARNRSPEGSWGWLVEEYRRSPEFADLADLTRRDYQNVLSYLEPLKFVPLFEITAPKLMELRDSTARKRGRRMANYCLQVISLIFSWGIPRGKCSANPAINLPKLKRAKDAPIRNRRWGDNEIAAFLAEAPEHLALPVAIGAYTGLREGDVLRLTWNAIQNGILRLRQGKTKEQVTLPLHRDLASRIENTPKKAIQVCTTSRGIAWTSSGFRASFRKELARLVADGKIQPGLTFHGLRHTVASKLAEAGADTLTIMAVTGHRTEEMVRGYTRQAELSKRATAAVRLLEQ